MSALAFNVLTLTLHRYGWQSTHPLSLSWRCQARLRQLVRHAVSNDWEKGEKKGH